MNQLDASSHSELRKEVCDYIARNSSRYALFVEEAIGFENYVESMRKQGTYGTHIELSAFVQIYQRPVTVIQRNLIYVVGVDTKSPPSPQHQDRDGNTQTLSPRRSSKARGKAKAEGLPELIPQNLDRGGTGLFVGYHLGWEHYTSLRSIQGPHTGAPCLKPISDLRGSVSESSPSAPSSSSSSTTAANFNSADESPSGPTSSFSGSPEPDQGYTTKNVDLTIASTVRTRSRTLNGSRTSSKRTDSPGELSASEKEGENGNKLRAGIRLTRSGTAGISVGGKKLTMKEKGLTRRQKRTEELKNGTRRQKEGRGEQSVELEKMKLLYI